YSSSASNIAGFRHVLSTLVKFNEEGEAVPELATDWEVSEDNHTLTVELREDVNWHDGEPFTAEDVEFTFNLAKDEDYTGQRSSISRHFEKIEAIDDHTVEFTMSEPDFTLLRRQNPYYILPKHV